MESKIHLLLLILWQVGVGVLGNPPRLNVSDEFVLDVNENSVNNYMALSLRCEGTEQLNWNWSTTLPFDDPEVNIQHHHHIGSDYPYVSTLTIGGQNPPIPDDTGYYYCHYNDVTDYNMDTERVAKSYIYVHDGATGLVNQNKYFSYVVTTAEKLVLDCRTTLPNITVTLEKDGEEVKNDERVTSFDSRVGYVIRNLKVSDGGQYECITTVDQMTTIVVVEPSRSSKLPQPAIEYPPNQHFVVGNSFILNCTLIFNKKVAFHWTFPNDGIVHGHHNFTRTKVQRMDSSYEISILRIFNATLDDTGEYGCQVTSKGHDSNVNYKMIPIIENQDHFINISGVGNVKIKESEQLKLKTTVHAYPPDPQIIYKNWTKQEIIETDRITTEHKVQEAESWLYIENVSVFEFGNYTIEVISSDGKLSKEKSMEVIIESKPYPELNGIPDSVNENEELQPSCKSWGYPLPEVNWMYTKCRKGPEDCSEYESIIPEKPSEVTDLKPGNVRDVRIFFTTNESGILLCNSSNEFGFKNVTRNVVISDIGGHFVFRHTGRNISIDFKDDTIMHELKIIENDDFHLLCGGVKFDYSKIELLGPGHEGELEKDSNVSDYSLYDIMKTNKASKRLEGEYKCLAYPHGEFTPHELGVNVTVLEEQKVTFTVDANMMPDGNMKEVQESEEFTLNCTVTGQPEPLITWYKDGTLLTAESDLFGETAELAKNQQTIHFEYIFDDHVGTYTCEAKNRLGMLTGSLTITVPRPGLTTGTIVGLTFALIGILFLMLVVFVLVRRVKKERKFRKSFRKNELYLFEKGNLGQLNPDCAADEQAELLPYSPEWEVMRDDITLGRQLGAGAFGRVVKATVTGLDEEQPKTVVALKMCKSQADTSQIHALTCELKIMAHLGKHLNIVNLMGANTVNVGKGELWILVEFCRYGNLLSFMHRHRKDFTNQINPITGKIDPQQTVQDFNYPQSPIPDNMRSGYRSAPITDQDGYLAPKTELAPDGPSSPLQSPNTTSASSGGSYRSDSSTQHAHNPSYGLKLNRSVSEGPQGVTPRLGRTFSTTSGDSRMLQSTLSPSQSPLSPTDSNHISDMGVDSQGNPFSFETGQIPGVNAPFNTSDLVCWGWQVAQGMDYLRSRKVLHGDLAARNLLLADNNVVKISDFGLSRDMYKKDIYMKKGDDLMPIKWMSVEAIRDRIFSIQSDVWAYGITLWELFTLGSTPYPGIEVNHEFMSYLEEGNRMNRPKYANKDIYDILLDCWNGEPQNRPSFSMIAERLGRLMLPDLRGEFMTMNDTYLQMNEARFKNETDYLNMLSSPEFDSVNKRDEAETTYLNIQSSVNGTRESRESNYLSMGQPEAVRYSVNRASESNTLPVPNNYLPMGSAKGVESPMVDVFSPRPVEESRFSFYEQESEKALLDKREHLNEDASEESALMRDKLCNIVEDDPSLDDNLEINSGGDGQDLNYVNLVTHKTGNT